MNRAEAFDNLRGVLNELSAVKFSVAYAAEAIRTNPLPLKSVVPAIRPSDIRDCGGNLEITYILRLFAEFEGALREYWAAAQAPRPPRRTQMKTLMDRVAARLHVAGTDLDRAHEVRMCRNEFTHDRTRKSQLTFNDCKSRLGVFLSHLPIAW